MLNRIKKPFLIALTIASVVVLICDFIDIGIAIVNETSNKIVIIGVILTALVIIGLVVYIVGGKRGYYNNAFVASLFYELALIIEIIKAVLTLEEDVRLMFAPTTAIKIILVIGCMVLLITETVLNTVEDKRRARRGDTPTEKKSPAKKPADPELLRQYHELLNSGAISQEEYDEVKNRILNK